MLCMCSSQFLKVERRYPSSDDIFAYRTAVAYRGLIRWDIISTLDDGFYGW